MDVALRVAYDAEGRSPLEAVSRALAGLASAYDSRRELTLPSRVVAELYIDGRLVSWEAEAGWLETCALGEWHPLKLTRTVVEYSEDLGMGDE